MARKHPHRDTAPLTRARNTTQNPPSAAPPQPGAHTHALLRRGLRGHRPGLPRDDSHARADALHAQLAAERAAHVAELEALHHQLDALHQQLATERTAHRRELTELRDHHMRELAELRTRFHDEQVRALGEAQEREEKLAAALNVALLEIDRRPSAPRNPTPAQPPAPSPPPTATTDSRTSLAESLATIAAGLGTAAFGAWLLSSRRS